ncbi:Transmembrane protein 87A [Porites harrisoni]
MAAINGCLVVFIVMFSLISVSCFPESGIRDLHFNKKHTYRTFSKTMNKGYTVAIKGQCSNYSGSIQINWRLEISQCAEMFSFVNNDDTDGMKRLWDVFANLSLTGENTVPCTPSIHLTDVTDKVGELILPGSESDTDGTDDNNQENDQKASEEENKDSKEESTASSITVKAVKTASSKAATKKETTAKHTLAKNKVSSSEPTKLRNTQKTTDSDKDNNVGQQRRRRGSEEDGKATEKEATMSKTKASKKEEAGKTSSDDKKVENRICVTKHDGVYLLIVNAYTVDKDKNPTKEDFKLSLHVEMKGKHGYLSASDWPLYPFYGVMSLLYVFYGVVWLIVSACQWRDLLRIQFWIGGVIALGMLEKAVFFSEYNNINVTGETNPALTIFAELVSCVKRTLARILVIIVSMGFGIVKPRLGTALHRVLGVGGLYFILAAIEGCFRSLHPKSDPGRQQLIASIPLAVLDASICWWIFMSLVQTTRTLRIRRNLVKLSLYRHFTNTLIFAVLASVAYMIWSIKTHRFAKDGCITDWSELWLDEAFWHFLFSIVLLVIMVLWRPTANNQRYAFTPIVDFGDDDEDDDNMTLSDAFDGMKMRNVKNVPEVFINGESKRKNKPEDDLKWVEENIPSSAADAVLPSVLDSDEELMTTKFEMSKME